MPKNCKDRPSLGRKQKGESKDRPFFTHKGEKGMCVKRIIFNSTEALVGHRVRFYQWESGYRLPVTDSRTAVTSYRLPIYRLVYR